MPPTTFAPAAAPRVGAAAPDAVLHDAAGTAVRLADRWAAAARALALVFVRHYG